MGVSRQEYWSGLPFPSPGILSHPGIEPVSLGSPTCAGSFFTTSTTWECQNYISINQNKNENRKQQDNPVPSLLLAPCNEGWLPLVFIIVHAPSLSHVQLFETPWTIACQAPLSLGLFRQEYWSGLPCPPPGDLPNPGIESTSPVSPALAGGFFTTEPPGKPQVI